MEVAHPQESRLSEVLPSESEIGRIKQIINTMQALVGTDAMPAHIKSVEAAFATMLKGLELGLPPMYSLQQVYLVRGKASIQTEAMLSLVARSGVVTWEILENTIEVATVRIKRKDTGIDFTYSFTREMAERAGLWNGQGPWKQYPEVMLYNRAMSTALRRACPDLIAGVYTPDELGFDPEKGPRVESLEEVEAANADGDQVKDVDFEEVPEEKPEGLPVPLTPNEKMAEAEDTVRGVMADMDVDVTIEIEGIATSADVTAALNAIGVPAGTIRAIKTRCAELAWKNEDVPSPFTPADHQTLFSVAYNAWGTGFLPWLLYESLCLAAGVRVTDIVYPEGLEPPEGASEAQEDLFGEE